MRKILLIELSATLRHLLDKLFAGQSFELQSCKSYAEAVTILSDSAHGSEHYSTVLLGWPDYTDPEADEIIALLDEPHNAALKVVVLSHETDSAILEWVTNRNLTALILWDDYRECLDVIRNIGEKRETGRVIEMALPEPEIPIRVLFVDDSPTVRVNFRRLLLDAGYETDTASCVREGEDKAMNNHYDIAIIDYFLPDGTGDQLCAALRDHPRTNRITCAIITGTYHDKVIKDSLDAGAVECMFKNEGNELFLARIASMSRMKRIMGSIEKDHKRLEGILSSVGDGVYGVNSNGNVTFINPAAKEILGYDKDANLAGKSPHEEFHGQEADGSPINKLECPLAIAYGTGQQLIASERTFKRCDGQFITVECTVFPLVIEGVLEGSVVAFRDITVRKLLEDELKWQATHDSLTNLANRYYFEEQLQDEVIRLKRASDTSALLYLDLDRFKYINDTAGHAAGDKLLVEIGRNLSTRLRSADTLARIGGDEFAIILRNVTEKAACETAEVFRSVLESYTFYYEGKSYVINVSVGLVMMDKNTESHGEVLANADLACFIAKGKGRNNTHVFGGDDDHKAIMDKDLGWSVRLREALTKDMFKLHFQPIVPLHSIDVDAFDGEVTDFINQYYETPEANITHNEVLLRMPDSRGKLTSPDAFLPTAERFNMMNDIDRWVIKNSVARLAEMEASGKTTVLSINLSAQTLKDKSLAEYVDTITKSYSVDPTKLLFEITENSAIANLDSANRLINDLKILGCQFALDDFGRGFCSFSHLKYLPVDYIKIDGIFIQGLLHDTIDKAIVNSVVQIAHSVGKKTIAEYVESFEVIKTLKHMGVDYVQGFYISSPKQDPENSTEPSGLVPISLNKQAG